MVEPAAPLKQRDAAPNFRTRRELIVVGIVLIGFAVAVGSQTWKIVTVSGLSPSGPAAFPVAVTGGLLMFSLLFLLQASKRSQGHLERHIESEHAVTHMGTVGQVVGALILYAAVLGSLGYLIATTALFVSVSRILGSKRWVLNVIVGGVLSAAVYFGFTMLLGVRLPAGVLRGVL